MSFPNPGSPSWQHAALQSINWNQVQRLLVESENYLFNSKFFNRSFTVLSWRYWGLGESTLGLRGLVLIAQ